jgi:hypothetical protein
MAYPTCPWCLTPQMVADENDSYTCLTCSCDVRFFECPRCGLRQTVNKQWSAFTCSDCEAKVDLPRRWAYSTSTKAGRVEGVGQPWPKF